MTENHGFAEQPHIRGHQRAGGGWAPTTGHRGRTGSWIAVGLAVIGFVLAGIALTLGPSWPMMWVGAGLMAAGLVVALASDIFTDVVLDPPRYEPEEPHTTPLSDLRQTGRHDPPR